MSQTEDYGVDDKNEIVNAVRDSQVSNLFIEFLQQGGPKPHVVMRLKIKPVIAGGRPWEGCRLAMDLLGGYDGVFHITPLPYDNASFAAHAAFEFKLKVAWTVENLIATIREPDVNLLDFSFAGGFKQAGDRTEYTDGCRDFIAQFFITLHRWGVVDWQVSKIDKGFFPAKNLKVVLGKTGFHEIIGYNYATSKTATKVTDLPIARGVFSCENFRRTIKYDIGNSKKYSLPYRPKDLQYGDDGFKQPDTDWCQWGWDEEYNCNSRWRWKNGVAVSEYDNGESSAKGKGKAKASVDTEASTSATTEVRTWPGDPTIPDPCYFIRDLEYYYQADKVISGPYDCPKDVWVYSEIGWQDAQENQKWRYWDGTDAVSYGSGS